MFQKKGIKVALVSGTVTVFSFELLQLLEKASVWVDDGLTEGR